MLIDIPQTATMFDQMRFSGQWRDYQQRVLDECETHLTDDRIHVVAAPGSGKTILGLELMRRIGRSTIILSPSRAIRDQWAARLVPLFMPEMPDPTSLAFDFDRSAIVTTATYQALHAQWASDDSTRWPQLIATVSAAGPVTLILDEAHHLRREWWSALQSLSDALPRNQIVALTATPPYDAPFAEWQRYEAMCGPADLEIGVPELVRNGDLCPHQDHVLLSLPGVDALDLLDQRREAIAAIQTGLRTDDELLDALSAHGWLTDPLLHTEAILEAPEMLSAMIVHLAASGRAVPKAPLELLGIGRGEIPPSSLFWVETLLNGLVFDPDEIFQIGDVKLRNLRSILASHGLIEGKAVRLTESRRIFSLMAGSIAKLDSIVAIARSEAKSLGDNLRMVVLADHVRADDIKRAGDEDYQPTKLGVIPIFNALRRAGCEGHRVAVLTGSLVIVPDVALADLNAVARMKGVLVADLTTTALPSFPGYLRVEASSDGLRRIVEIMTEMLLCGHITMLVGTQALLGEGWDAPAINSLVLASNSAAYMLSNQMRGRAIRIDPHRPEKVSNIWHLATITEPTLPGLGAAATTFDWGQLGGQDAITSDIDLLQRRFRTFEGVANTGSRRIESGIARLAFADASSVAEANAKTLAVAEDRAGIRARWQASLGDAVAHAKVRETATPNYAPRRLVWPATLQWLAASAASGGVFAAANVLRGASSLYGLAGLVMAASAAAGVAALPKLARACWLTLRNGSLEGSLQQVGKAVVSGLHYAGTLSDDELVTASIMVETSAGGQRSIVAGGLSRASERAVIQAFADVLGPVQNPRYLLVRQSRFAVFTRADYHAVPTILGQRKEWAEHFRREWRRHVGPSRLVFTRTIEGRIALLRARARSFAAGFQRQVDRRSAWQ